jgi:hypothetical protein
MSERILIEDERQALLMFLYSALVRRESVEANALVIEKLRAITKLFEGSMPSRYRKEQVLLDLHPVPPRRMRATLNDLAARTIALLLNGSSPEGRDPQGARGAPLRGASRAGSGPDHRDGPDAP